MEKKIKTVYFDWYIKIVLCFNDLIFVICEEHREKVHKKRVYFEMFTQTFENKL